MAIANGSPYYNAPALLRRFGDDLAPVMAFFAVPGDLIVCNKKPNADSGAYLAEMGVSEPEFVTLAELASRKSEKPTEEYELKSWGKSPAEANLFSFIDEQGKLWRSDFKVLSERKTAALFLKSFLEKHQETIFINSSSTAQIIHSIEEAEKLLSIRHPLVLKAPLSSSGRGLLVLRRSKLNEPNKQLIKTIIEQQGYLTAEPWLNKVQDLSFQFEIGNNGQVDYLGTTWFFTNSNGQYAGHFLNFGNNHDFPVSEEYLRKTAEALCEELKNSVFGKIHRGPIGIDALLFRDGENRIKIQPCVEINPRYTMGHLCLQLEKRIHPDSFGEFRIHFAPKGHLSDFASESAKKNPPISIGGFIKKGHWPLNPTDDEARFYAYLELF